MDYFFTYVSRVIGTFCFVFFPNTVSTLRPCSYLILMSVDFFYFIIRASIIFSLFSSIHEAIDTCILYKYVAERVWYVSACV